MNRAARQTQLLAEQLTFQHSLRSIEADHKEIHELLLQWGTWGRDRFPGCPEIARPAIWELPGAYDPDLDPDAVPESPEPPINEKGVIVLDERINDQAYPSVWVKVLKINYVWRPVEWDRPGVARMGREHYLDELHMALDALKNQ